MRYFLVLFLILSLAGCGSHKRGEPEDDVSSFSTTVSPGGAPLSDEEVAIGLRICYAYRSKHTRFRTDYLNTIFKFDMSTVSCDSDRGSATINTTLKLDSDVMHYDVQYDGTYNWFVQTHADGHLTNICNELFQGGNPVNVSVSSDLLMEFTFFSGLQDGYLVRFARPRNLDPESPDFDLAYDVYMLERFYVETNSTAAGGMYGLVSRWERRIPCGDGDPEDFKEVDSQFRE